MSPSAIASANALPLVADAKALRTALGRFATGVAVVTTRGRDGRLVGLTVNSFASVSLDPPLVLWSIRKESALAPIFRTAPVWAVSVLGSDQHDIARRLCAPVEDRFEHVSWREGSRGAPLIEGAIAWFQCTPWLQVDGGDHVMLLGQVEESVTAGGAPLVFHDGRFGEWRSHA